MARAVGHFGYDDDGFVVERVDLARGFVVLSVPGPEAYAFVQEVRECEEEGPLYGSEPLDSPVRLNWESEEDEVTLH